MNKNLAYCLAILALLVTGCPHNYYIVELTPKEKAMVRQITFYRADQSETNITPTYEAFPPDEMAIIASFYPTDSISQEGTWHIARGEFANQMPGDIGGSGSYTNLVTSLGSGAVYAERFRGQDDLAALAGDRLAVVDQLADILLGWSKYELGHESHYKNLEHFLDNDCRRDLKSLSTYWWLGQVSTSYNTNSTEEFVARAGQFLIEHGYLKTTDLMDFLRSFASNDNQAVLHLLQRLVADKLKVAPGDPLPKSLAFLADTAAMAKSRDEYLATTDQYHAKVKQWKKDKKSNPDLKKPEPSEVMDDLARQLIDLHVFNSDDHLTVKLATPMPPVHTNGKWDETQKQILWESDLDGRTNGVRFPVFCYAAWSRPDADFQTQHFGHLVLNGDDLLQYCFWHGGLGEKRIAEWDALLAGLQPGKELADKVGQFRFSDEPPEPDQTDEKHRTVTAAAYGRELLKSALQ